MAGCDRLEMENDAGTAPDGLVTLVTEFALVTVMLSVPEAPEPGYWLVTPITGQSDVMTRSLERGCNRDDINCNGADGEVVRTRGT